MYKFSAIALLFVLLNARTTNTCEASPLKNNDPYPFEVNITGQGSRSIIFIPGFASSGKVWSETAAKFEKGYKCYTLTMAGFAGIKPQGTATFKDWTTGIAHYIKDNNLGKTFVIGHSMGGALALALAAEYPELIEKIVVVDALPCLAAMRNPAFKPEVKPDCSAMISQMVNLTDEQFIQMQKMTARGLAADTTTHQTIVDWSMASDRNTMGQMFCDFMNTDLREELRSVKCPALILLQPYFKNVGSSIDSQYQNLKTANLQYATKGLHFIMFDDKQWYLDQVNNFIVAK